MIVVDVINLSSSANTLLRERVLALRAHGVDNRILCIDGPYVAPLREAGIPVETVDLPRGFDPPRLVRALLQIARYLRAHRVDVVHTHCSVPGAVGRLAAWLARVPVVVHTVHGFHAQEGMRWYVRWPSLLVEKALGLMTDTLLTQNRSDLEMAGRHGIGPADRRRLIGNGIDLERFDYAGTRPLPTPPVILCAARFEPVKNHDLLFDAIERLDARGCDFRLRLVGTGALEDRYRARAREHGLEDRVEFLGYRDDMPDLLAGCDVAVLPSLKEGMPRAVLEAMAVGRPVVGTRVPGTREAIKDGQTGFLVEADDADGFADAVAKLLRDAALRATMGSRGRQVAEEEFDERPIAGTLHALYEERLAARRPPAAPAAEAAVRVGRNFVYRIGSQAGSAVINVAAMVLLGRSLGAEGYGNYSFWYALIPLISNLAGAGIGIVVTREVARDPERAPRLIGDAIVVRLLLGALVLLGVAILSPALYGPGHLVLVLVVTGAALLDFSQDVSIWVLRGHERLDLEARLLLLSQVVWFAIIAAAVAMHAGLTALIAAATIAFAVRAVAGAWLVRNNFHHAEFAPDRFRLWQLVREGLPFGLALFGVVLYGRIGLLTLKSLGTAADVSYFQVAYLLSQPFTFIATALAMAMFPGLARRARGPVLELRGSLRRALKCQFLMGLPLTLGLVLLADPLIHLLFKGNGFDQAAAALRLMSLGITVIFLNHAARYTLAALDHQRDYLAAVGFGIAVNASLCVLLVPRLGFPGACLAFLGAELTIWIIQLRALASWVSVTDVARDALRPLAAAGLAALWMLGLDATSPYLVTAAAAATYVLVLWWTHALTEGEMRVLRRVFHSFLGPRGPASAAAGRMVP